MLRIFSLVVILMAVNWPSQSIHGQQLILYYDFEGDTPSNIQDKSNFGAPANGVLVDSTSSIVSDPNDATRGQVLRIGESGYGATIPHVRKMDFKNSYTLQAWFKSADSLAVWQQIAGFAGGGPRFFNHWGLGSVGNATLYNTEFGISVGFDPVQFVSPSGFVDGSTWHHLLLTWNSEEQKLYGYYDGFDGGDPDDAGLSPVNTLGDLLVTHPSIPFIIGDPRDAPPLNGQPHPEAFIDDVAFWQGYAPPEVVARLFDRTLSVVEATSLMVLPGATADFNRDGYVDGDDFLTWQRGYGLDDVATLAVLLGDGDANGDLKVDGLDLVYWESSFGSTLGITAVIVPEPSSVALFLSVLCLANLVARR